MKKSLLGLAGGMVALALASCAYDPYYNPSYASSSSVGYSTGYGYGGSSFSTSVFVGTGDSRWGYDPDCHSYYDYQRRCYYDPYLNGYYPVGHRPVVVYGAPHPHGWRPGRSYISPPRHVTNITISNYRDRESSYRRSNYSWARQVQQRPSNYSRPPEPRQSASTFGGQGSYERPSSQGYRPSGNSYSPRESQNRYNRTQSTQPTWGNPSPREKQSRPSRYNQQLVTQSAPQPSQETSAPPAQQQATSFGSYRQQAPTAPAQRTSPFGRNRQESQPAADRPASPSFGGRQQAQPQPSNGSPQAPQRRERGGRGKKDEPEAL